MVGDFVMATTADDPAGVKQERDIKPTKAKPTMPPPALPAPSPVQPLFRATSTVPDSDADPFDELGDDELLAMEDEVGSLAAGRSALIAVSVRLEHPRRLTLPMFADAPALLLSRVALHRRVALGARCAERLLAPSLARCALRAQQSVTVPSVSSRVVEESGRGTHDRLPQSLSMHSTACTRPATRQACQSSSKLFAAQIGQARVVPRRTRAVSEMLAEECNRALSSLGARQERREADRDGGTDLFFLALLRLDVLVPADGEAVDRVAHWKQMLS